MKKLFFVLLSLLLFEATGVKAQDAEEQPVEKMYTNFFGIRAGVNYSNINPSTDLKNKPAIALNAGLYAESMFHDHFSILFEANYSKKTASFTLPALASFKENVEFTFIDFPLMLNWYPVKHLSIGVGVQASLLVHNEYKVSALGTSVTDELPKNSYSPGYIGFVAGLNYKISPSFNVDLKYNPQGTIHVNEGTEANADFQKQQFSTITLRVGYSIIKN